MTTTSFWRGRKVFLTGHTGFKGSWLTLWLKSLGAEVTGFSLAPETTPNLFSLAAVAGDCRSVIGDIRDLTSLSRALSESQPEIVIHMAAQALVQRSYRDPVETYATNVMGTVNLLEAVRKHGTKVRSVVVVTSDKCYQNQEWLWGYRENEPMGGHDPYSNSKGCAELVTASFRDSFFNESGVRIASARAGNVIGGGDWSENRLIPDIMKSCLAGQPVLIRNPRAIRPWQHVLEPLAGYLQLAEALSTTNGKDFANGWNFGPFETEVQPVEAIVKRVAAAWPGMQWSLDTKPQPHEAHYLKLDSSKARTLLNWSPRLGIDETIDWIVAWYRNFQANSTNSSAVRAFTQKQISAYSDRMLDTQLVSEGPRA